MDVIYRFVFTEKHLLTSVLRYREQIWWRRPFARYRWQTAIIAFLLLLAGVYSSQLLTIAAGGVLGALLVGWPIDALVYKRRFMKSPYYMDKLTITLSSGGMEAVGESSSTRIDWSLFTKARRFRDGLLLFQGQYVFNWLPDAAAQEPAMVQAAIELVRAHVEDYRDA